jgi:hypothetical protein
MDLWDSISRTWPDRIVNWNRAGIRWREMGAVEMMWMHHRDNIDLFAQHRKGQMRQYLLASRDYETLAAWDAQSMNETDQSVGEV